MSLLPEKALSESSTPTALLDIWMTLGTGDFRYKLPGQAAWKRLATPANARDLGRNCELIGFGYGGMSLTQSHPANGASCVLKLILKSPTFVTINGQPVIEAECAGTEGPDFIPDDSIENRNLPLAILDSTVTAVMVTNLGHVGGSGIDFDFNYNGGIRDLIRELVEPGYRPLAGVAQASNTPHSLPTTLRSPLQPPTKRSLEDYSPNDRAQKRLQTHKADAKDYADSLKQSLEQFSYDVIEAVHEAINQVWQSKLTAARQAMDEAASRKYNKVAIAVASRRYRRELNERYALILAVVKAIERESKRRVTEALRKHWDQDQLEGSVRR